MYLYVITRIEVDDKDYRLCGCNCLFLNNNEWNDKCIRYGTSLDAKITSRPKGNPPLRCAQCLKEATSDYYDTNTDIEIKF